MARLSALLGGIGDGDVRGIFFCCLYILVFLFCKNNKEMRLQPIHVPGTHFQLLKSQKSTTTSKTHSLTAFILPGAWLGFRAQNSRKVETVVF
jgi:hypothetical protein